MKRTKPQYDAFIKERLDSLATRPLMFAATREAFAAQVTLLAELAGVAKPNLIFYFAIPREPGKNGPDLETIVARPTDEWASSVVAKAWELIKNEETAS